MVKVKLLLIGKTNKSFLIEGENEYLKRLQHYIKIERLEIQDIKNQKHLTINQIKNAEGLLYLDKLKNDDYLILLDEKGTQMTSKYFSEFINNKSVNTSKNIVFAIGGAYGFSDELYKRCNFKMSLSKMTFSHQMVRMIFLEQLYRACTIMKGEPYHHE
jgi:23S rRNA (pseudouridine1915-N3)-methyltransferase